MKSVSTEEVQGSDSADNVEHYAAMRARADRMVPFTAAEVDTVVSSLQAAAKQRLEPGEKGDGEDKEEIDSGSFSIDWEALNVFVTECGHVSYKDWTNTEELAQRLRAIIGDTDTPVFRRMFRRVLADGGWDQAYAAAATNVTTERPWAVLIAGLNGVRKTTSVYQPWFREALGDALGLPEGGRPTLPCGQSCFFRQLDYMLVCLACTEFRRLYEGSGDGDVAAYSAGKAAIFARFRTLAEVVGVLLLQDAKRRGMGVMVETSGRDISSMRYIEQIFGDCGDFDDHHRQYQKLLVHFTIDNLSAAEASVDARMSEEISQGVAVISVSGLGLGLADSSDICSDSGVYNGVDVDMRAVMQVNLGGPYGSSVLADVQQDSDRVMGSVFDECNSDIVSDPRWVDWMKARISIHAAADSPTDWTARGTVVHTSIHTGTGTCKPTPAAVYTFRR